MESKSVFAKNLKRYMDDAGKTRNDICKDLGFNYYTFTSWVNGTKYPRMDKVEALARYFNIAKSDLIEEKPTETGGLSMNKTALMVLVEEMTEDQAALALRLLKTILEYG